ncbi:MAG TPA: hypothetical protein VIC02_04355 [Kineobactrum sp.]
MVPRHHDDIRLQFHQSGNCPVQLLDGGHLAVEVAILAAAVGILEVQKKKIVVRPGRLQRVDFAIQIRTTVFDLHAQQPGPLPGVMPGATG